MKMPPLLLAAAVLFWGWQTGMWAVAAPVAVALAAARFLPLRWEFANTQLYRIADFCTVLTVLLGAYLFIAYGNPRAIVLLFEWLPLALLPLALAHAYGASERLELSVVFWNLRRNPPLRPLGFDPYFPYFALWVIAASAANMRDEWFFAGLALLVAWPLVMLRPLSYPVGVWAAAFFCAVAIGYGAQYGLRELQLWLEGVVPDWIAGTGSRTNPYKSMTDIGYIGELKQSDAIVLRVTAEGAVKPPRLLRRASYNFYTAASWIAHGAAFTTVPSAPQPEGWTLVAQRRGEARVAVHDYSVHTNPVLSVPAGTVEIDGLQAQTVRRNLLGAVQIERPPGFFSYIAAFMPGLAFEGLPTPDDTRVSRAEREEFARLAMELGLMALPPPAAVEKVRGYFRDRFQYATYQKERGHGASPIVDFVRRTRAGHCEYFATATALLLRAAGIPARYATGFAVQEFSPLEGAYIVRERHAHSWVSAYVDGAWTDVDTTPPEWFGIEAGTASIGSGARDVWSWLRFRVAQAWSRSDEHALTLVALLVALPFGLWLAWRLYRARRIVRESILKVHGPSAVWPGSDSEFYLIERRLGELGWARRPYETVSDWLERLRADTGVDLQALTEIVGLHYRYRFDPSGLTQSERLLLKQSATSWLVRHAAAAP